MRHLYAVGLIVGVFFSSAVKAEYYAGASLGYTGSNRFSDIKGDENLNYPGTPNPLYRGAKTSPIHVEEAPTISVKGGYYLEDNAPSWGIEGEAGYTKTEFGRQNVALSHSGFATFVEDQQPMDVTVITLSADLMRRFNKWNGFTPYVGAGPSLYIYDIEGTGRSGIIVGGNSAGVNGPAVDETPISWGANFKAGAEYEIVPNLGLGAEYRYNWNAFETDKIRSLSNISATAQAHTLAITLVKHF